MPKLDDIWDLICQNPPEKIIQTLSEYPNREVEGTTLNVSSCALFFAFALYQENKDARPKIVDLIDKLLQNDQIKAEIAADKDKTLPHEEEKSGSTLLHCAAWYHMDNVVNFLIKSDANVDAIDIRGNRPLENAMMGQKKALERGATLSEVGSLITKLMNLSKAVDPGKKPLASPHETGAGRLVVMDPRKSDLAKV